MYAELILHYLLYQLVQPTHSPACTMSFQSILSRNSFNLTRDLLISKLKPFRSTAVQIKRNLNLQEYQSKDLMRQNGVTVQKFIAVHNLDDVNPILDDTNSELFNCKEYVIKAQVLAGGRGKGMCI